jgi:predicted PurR-regulated permease PerM
MNDKRLFRLLLLANLIAFVALPVLFWFLYSIRSVFAPVLTALLVGYLLYPAVYWGNRVGIPRMVTTLGLVLGLVASTALALFSVLPAARKQILAVVPLNEWTDAAKTIESAPAPARTPGEVSLEDFADPPGARARSAPETAHWIAAAKLRRLVLPVVHQLRAMGLISGTEDELMQQVSRWSLNFARKLLKTTVETGRFLILFFFILIFALAEGHKIQGFVLRFVPNEFFEPALFIFHKSQFILGAYLRGLFVENIIMGMLSFLLLVPLCLFTELSYAMAVVVALIIAVTNVVRIIGPIVGGVIGALLGFSVTNSWAVLLGIAIVVIIVQTLDGPVIIPLVMKDQLDIHPVVCLLGIIVGGIIGGALGMIMAIPVIGGIKVVYRVVSVEMARLVEPGDQGDYTLEHPYRPIRRRS